MIFTQLYVSEASDIIISGNITLEETLVLHASSNSTIKSAQVSHTLPAPLRVHAPAQACPQKNRV